MSYSFSVRATTKAEALAEANTKFDDVVKGQPPHAADMDTARAALAAFVAVLPDDDTKDVALSVNGSVSGAWTAQGTMESLLSVSFSVTASLATRV